MSDVKADQRTMAIYLLEMANLLVCNCRKVGHMLTTSIVKASRLRISSAISRLRMPNSGLLAFQTVNNGKPMLPKVGGSH